MPQKKFQELNLNDAFLFAAALEDPETCRLVLELLLGRPVGPVKVRAERSMLYSKDFRYVRLDVFASDEVDVAYNLEMQNAHKSELPKRSLFHQAEMDVTALLPGQDFRELAPSYVIFICTYDPFSSGYYRYTFEERCVENGEPLGDGTQKIFLNTKGTNSQDVPPELIRFLWYVEHSTEEVAEQSLDGRLHRLHEKVAALKRSRQLEESYMTMEELMEERESRGKTEGQNLILELVSRMADDGLSGELGRLKADESFRTAMLEKYHLI